MNGRQRNFLGLLVDEGASIARGLTVGHELHRLGYVTIYWGRYRITDAGRAALSAPAGTERKVEPIRVKGPLDRQGAFEL